MAEPRPAPDAPDLGGLDAVAIGGMMSEQFLELLALWTEQMTTLARAGVDPTPLVHTLSRTLRSAADQLDPAGAAAPERPST